MHITDQIAKILKRDVWQGSGDMFFKLLADRAPPGTFSDGSRVVRLRFDDRGRYLERVDGWGKVEKDVDLRDYENRPEAAIKAVLSLD